MEIFAFHAPMPGFLDETAKGFSVSLRVPVGLELDSAWVRSEPDNEEFLSPLKKVPGTAKWTLWQGPLRLNSAEEVTLYSFKFLVNNRQYWLSSAGISSYFPERDLHFHFNPHYQPAKWVYSQVFYQIFPERFFDGNPDNNVTNGEYLYDGKPVVAKAWNELPERKQGPREFYGGDLAGIQQKIPYLQELGVTALYLNPIFESPSSHKYDTMDYYRIDPHFGSNEDFARLCQELHEQDMRIVLDAVVNHTSERHPWFDRQGEHGNTGAYQSQSSPTRDFYSFRDNEDPESYHGWYDVKTLPVLNFASKELQERVFAADDAILRYWLRPPYAIDGWRFDVIHMLGEGPGAVNNATYARHFRETLRQENPEAYFLGEHFFEATKWLQGDQEDAAMNYYGFGMPLRAFLAGIDHRQHPVHIEAEDLKHQLARARVRIPFEIQLSQFNLLDSHDTPRFLTALNSDKKLMKLAVSMQFSYIGVPSVYYGDEVGLEGGKDPDSRRSFPWDKAAWGLELYEHYRQLIAFRRKHKVLQEGAFLDLIAKGDIYAFARLLVDDVVITVINRGQQASLSLPLWQLGLKDETLVSLFDGESYKPQQGYLKIELEPKSSQILYRFANSERKPD